MSAAKKHCALKPLQQLNAFYTGGSICLCPDEQKLVAACGEEAKVCAAVEQFVLRKELFQHSLASMNL
jgi:hypothetical protein